MQAAGKRTKRQAAALSGGGANENKQHAKGQQSTQPAASKKQKRRASDAIEAAPAAKRKRRSAPADAQPQKTPVATTRLAYNLRTRSSMPAAGTRFTDNSLPTGGLPSSVRPRNPNQKATWNELPIEVLKIICQHLDPATVLAARRVASGMREACGSAPVQLRFTLPMQSSPWAPAQLEAWERRITGIAGLLGDGKVLANEVQLRMEGAAAWKGEESMPQAQVTNTVQRLTQVLMPLRKLGVLTAKPITHLDIELPVTHETITLLASALPDVTSVCMDSLIPPPNNHVQALSDSRAYTKLRKLDVSVTAWDQVQHLSALTQLMELNVRYCMWNIPELTPLSTLQNLTTFGIEVLDDRARFQLDFLGPLVRGVPNLRHLRAAVILSRTVVSEGGPASCDFLIGCGLQTLELDVRVPQDAARTAHTHFRNLHMAPSGCKVRITIRADALPRETSFESAATRCANLAMPRLGMAHPAPPEPRERWAALNMTDIGLHPPDALTLLHLRGYRTALSMLPDLSAARLTRLQISNSRLSAADFVALSACTSLEHLFVRFTYQPEAVVTARTSVNVSAVCVGQAGLHAGTSGVLNDFIRPRELQSTLKLAAHAAHGMLTRSRKSLQEAGRRSTGSIATTPPPPPKDCSSKPAPYILQPLLELRKLRSLELLEEPQPPAHLAPRLSAVGPATAAPAAVGPAEPASRTRRSTLVAAADASTSAATQSAAPAAAAGLFQPRIQSSLPLTRSGLNHFLKNLIFVEHLQSLSLRLLAEEADLPDCPCRVPCFSAGMKDREPPKAITAERLQTIIRMIETEHCKVELGSLAVQSATWYRPSAWPSLDD